MAEGNNQITPKNLGDLLKDKSAEEVVEVFRECCTGRVKTLLDPASISESLHLLDAYGFSSDQSKYIRDVTDEAAKFLSKKKKVNQFAMSYDELSAYANNILVANALLDEKRAEKNH